VAHGIALFVYSKINVADTIPPKVMFTSPAEFANCVNIKSHITVTFSKILDSATISNSTFFLEDSVGNPVAATVSYSAKSRTATLIPSASLIYKGRYTLTVKGGTTPSVIKDNLGIHLQADFVWKFTASPPPDAPPDEGTGGPILVISSARNPFSRYPPQVQIQVQKVM